ncbi:MAG: DUF1499 domain-containing protein [Pseudomonadota bacterium]
MLRLTIVVVCVAAIVAGGAVIASGPGARLGVWDYGDGFGIMRAVAPYALGLSAASFAALAVSVFRARALVPLALGAALIAGVAGYVPIKMRELVAAHPFIHDVTTDFENPPAIIAAADLPRKNPTAYVGAEQAPRADEGVTVADAQRAAFPQIAPLYFEASAEDIAQAAKDVLGSMGMKILDEYDTEAGYAIEASYTSLWYGFVDDFIVRIQPSDDGRMRVDLRSKSRVGGSDLGANGRRVLTFSSKLRSKLERG